jgi:hypothetical protein
MTNLPGIDGTRPAHRDGTRGPRVVPTYSTPTVVVWTFQYPPPDYVRPWLKVDGFPPTGIVRSGPRTITATYTGPVAGGSVWEYGNPVNGVIQAGTLTAPATLAYAYKTDNGSGGTYGLNLVFDQTMNVSGALDGTWALTGAPVPSAWSLSSSNGLTNNVISLIYSTNYSVAGGVTFGGQPAWCITTVNNFGTAPIRDGLYDARMTAAAPVLRYRLDETAGPTAADAGSAALPGTYNGAITYSQAPLPNGQLVGTSVKLNASNQYVSRASAAAIDLTGDVTYLAWINPAAVADGTVLIKGFNGYRLWVFAGDVYFGGNSAFALGTTTTPIVAGARYFIVATRSGTSFTIYVNGTALVTTTSVNTAVADVNPLLVGTDNSLRSLLPTIDEVAILARALSPAEVLDLWNAGA